MMVGVAVDTFFVSTTTWDNMSGMVTQKPTPIPSKTGNPIHWPALPAALLVKEYQQARPNRRDRRAQDHKWVVDAGGGNQASDDNLGDGQNDRYKTDVGRDDRDTSRCLEVDWEVE